MSIQSIIVVDDDIEFGRLLKRVLSGMGHIVEQITDPRVLIDRYDSVAPDIIFLDIFMPDMNGMDVARRLSDMGFNGKLVFMTGHDRTFLNAARAAVIGSDVEVVTLVKPARVEQIREIVTGPSRNSRKQKFQPYEASATR